jgi:hypothetical protein
MKIDCFSIFSKMKKLNFVILGIGIFVLFSFQSVFAKIDLSIGASDVVFSKAEPIEGEEIRIFARVFNLGDKDVYGQVLFLNNGQKLTEPQPISIRTNTYDDVFIDWIVEQGTYEIEVKIVETNPIDENIENNSVIKQDFFVDTDTDKDGIGDFYDPDDDNDGLFDDTEVIWGTNPLVADTDNDGVIDGEDVFPLDSNETKDSDQDGIGNNADEDDDNDGLKDEEELWIHETNPLVIDTDKDELSDKEEVQLGTNPLKADTDEDGVIDSKDFFPLDPNRAQASIFESIQGFFENKKLPPTKISLLVGITLFVLLLLFLLRRKRRH